jgi:hypothetical protein
MCKTIRIWNIEVQKRRGKERRGEEKKTNYLGVTATAQQTTRMSTFMNTCVCHERRRTENMR